MKFLTNIDLNKNQLQNAVIQLLGTEPTGTEGQIYFNTATKRAYIHNGAEWIGSDALDAAMDSNDVMEAINSSTGYILDARLSAVARAAIAASHSHSNKDILDAITAAYKTTDATKLDYITITSALNLNTMNSAVALNTAKVTNATHTGDVTGSAALTITNKAVTNVKLADMSTKTLKGRNSALTGPAEDLSVATVQAMLNIEDGANKYIHPNHSGDVTSVADGATTIGANKVTNAKLTKVPSQTLKGRATANVGDVEDLTAAEVRTILNVENGANAYSHPNHSGDVTSIKDGVTTIGEGKVTNIKLAVMDPKSIKGRSSTTAGAPEDLSAEDVRVMLNVEAGANFYEHPNHTGDVTSVKDGATTIANKAVSLAKMADIPTATIIGRNSVGSGVPQALSKTDILTMLNVSEGAQPNAVTSVAGKTGAVTLTKNDVGLNNLTNDAQVKKITSSTNGNIPTWAGTAGDTLEVGYTVESTLTGKATSIPRADAVKAYVDGLLGANDAMIYKGTLGVGGTVTALPTSHSAGWSYKVITKGTYAGHICEIGDMIIAVENRSGTGNTNADWTVVQSNIDGAVTGPASATNGNIPLFDGATGNVIKNSAFSPASFAAAGHNHDAVYIKKFTAALGTGTAQVITHNLNTRDVTLTIRENSSPWSQVITDVDFTSLNTVTVRFATSPSANQYSITITG